MTSRELFERLYDLTDDMFAQIEVSGRYACKFKSVDPKSNRRKTQGPLSYFCVLAGNENSCTQSTYANLDVLDTKENKSYFGRLQMTVNEDLSGESKYAFSLYLKEHDADKNWTTSFAVPASSIELAKS